MYHVMVQLGIPKKLITTKITLRGKKKELVWKGLRSETFKVTKWLTQIGSLSTTLFNLVMESLTRNSGLNRHETIFTKNHQ